MPGLLPDRPSAKKRPPGDRQAVQEARGRARAGVDPMELAERLRPFAQERHAFPNQGLFFCCSPSFSLTAVHPLMSCLFLRGRRRRRQSNADVFGFELTKEDMDELDALDQGKEGAIAPNPVDVE